VRIRTRNPETVLRVLRKDLRRVGWAIRTAVMGEGEGVGRGGRRTGGSENMFWRDAVPRRVVGRDNCELLEFENTGPTC
jgi:hypothetical protein